VSGVTSGFIVATSQAIAKEVTWGIRKKDTRELVFVVNPGDFPIGVNNPPSSFPLYFTFRKKQSFVQYPNQTSFPVVAVKQPVFIQLIPPSNNPTATTISIAWQDGNPSPFADEFEIGISTNLRDFETTIQPFASTNAKTFTGLTPATRHIIRIRAFIGTSFSEYAYFEATTIQAPPEPPENVQLLITNERNIRVDWDAVQDDIFDYIVEVSEVSNFLPRIEGGIQRTRRTVAVFNSDIADLDFETEYFVRVRATRGGQSSVPTTPVSITTLSKPRTLAPIIVITDVSPTTVFFKIVNYDTRTAFLFVNLTGAPFSGSLGSARPGEAISGSLSYTTQTTLFAVAAATDKLGSEVASQIFVQDTPPAAPSIGATAIVVNPGFNFVNYTYETTDPIVDGFVVERDPGFLDVAGFSIVSPQLPPSARRFLDTAVSSGVQYTYRIRAFNRVGDALSNTRTVTAVASVPATPSNLTLIGVLAGASGEGFVSIAWQRNSTDEDGFLVQRKLSSQGAGSYVTVGGTAKAQTNFGETVVGDPNTNYDYRIIAYNQFGNSAPSNVLTVNIA
jgi:titin